jgi:hypothetical protein
MTSLSAPVANILKTGRFYREIFFAALAYGRRDRSDTVDLHENIT